MGNCHIGHPEIWFRPSPRLPLQVLLRLVQGKSLTATPRLGARNDAHPKGYVPGETAILRVLDSVDIERFSTSVCITEVVIRPVRNLTADLLQEVIPYQDWTEVQRELSLFEKRPVRDDEQVSVVRFSYL